LTGGTIASAGGVVDCANVHCLSGGGGGGIISLRSMAAVSPAGMTPVSTAMVIAKPTQRFRADQKYPVL
jgi:hypothetical protein